MKKLDSKQLFIARSCILNDRRENNTTEEEIEREFLKKSVKLR